MLSKKEVIAVIEKMPDTFGTTELFDRILLLEKIEEGRKDVATGSVFTTEQARRKLQMWLK